MKNGLILAICLLTSAVSFAQVDAKINPIGTIFGSPKLSVEVSPGEKFGIEANIGAIFNFAGLGIINYNVNEVSFKRNGYTGFLAGKYYFNEKRGMDGLSVGLYSKLKNVNYKAEVEDQVNENFDRNRVALGFIVSQKWVSDNNLVFSIDAGIGRSIINKFNYDDEANSSVNINTIPFLNVDGVFRMAVGYRFGGYSRKKI